MPNRSIFDRGRSVTVRLPDFTVRLGFLSEDRLHISVEDGPHAGFADSVSYQIDHMEGGTTILSWRERVGTCVVIAIDRELNARSYVSSRKDSFFRLAGRITPD